MVGKDKCYISESVCTSALILYIPTQYMCTVLHAKYQDDWTNTHIFIGMTQLNVCGQRSGFGCGVKHLL